MRALQHKLVRDLTREAAQVITISAVIACGIAGFVAMRGAWTSLETSRDDYYARYRFADVFAHLERAPDRVAEQIEDLDGVSIVEARLLEPIRVPLGVGRVPARGYAVSLPEAGEPRLNAIWLRAGRPVAPGRDDEALVLQAFADAHDLRPGDGIEVVMNGRLRRLRVVGVADSPEYTFPVAPGEMMIDASRFVVLWMSRSAMADLWDLSGAFDDVLIRVEPGADARRVADAVDDQLAPWGSTGAVPREDQLSSQVLEQEMAQLRLLASTIPVVFLGVAGFLLQIVMSRIVQLQRGQIATLKAFGYTRGEVARHYLGMVAAVGVLGTALGLALGGWLGAELTTLYADIFHLPEFAFRLDGTLVAIGVAVGVMGTAVATLGTVLRVAAMPPAEAMAPPAPPLYGGRWIDRTRALRILAPLTRMMARDLVRRPGRLLASVLGIAAATGVVVLGRFSGDAIDVFDRFLFAHYQAEDIAVILLDPVDPHALRAFGRMPGVAFVEGQRNVGARFRAGHVWRDGGLVGHPSAPRLRRLVEWPLRVLPVPERGITVTDALATLLGLRVGDLLDLELLVQDHPRALLPIVGLVREPVGLWGHVSLPTLAALLDEPVAVDTAFLSVAGGSEADVVRRLTEVPAVLSIRRKDEARTQFLTQTGRSRDVFTLIATAFGVSMAVAIVYNNARIALSARSRELASLRVLGFTRREVLTLVLGEQAVQVVLGVPLGLQFGRGMAFGLIRAADPETWRFPVVLTSRTYAVASLVVLTAALLSALAVARRVAGLDLVAALKTRE